MSDRDLTYFEQGCLCVLSDKIPKGDNYEYYLNNCTCSRHPESATRTCWDNDKKARAEAIARINQKYGTNYR